MAKVLRRSAIWLAAFGVVAFVVVALVRSAPRRATPVQPDRSQVVARFYGALEPSGGPVYVGSATTRTVIALRAAERDTVKPGDVLIQQERAIEEAQLASARGRAEAARQAYAISRDVFDRTAGLGASRGVSEQDLRQAQLKVSLDSASYRAAEAEAALAQARLDQLTLRSPIGGVLYKCDVRLGQTLAAGDDSRIVLGAAGRQARVYVESFWLDRVAVDAPCRVSDPETGRSLGGGRVLSLSPYLGGRTLRSEDPRERFDAEYCIAIVGLDSGVTAPIGLVVAVEFEARGGDR